MTIRPFQLLILVPVFLTLLFSTHGSFAQVTPKSDAPQKGNDLGIFFGPFLPYKIPGVTEVLNGWGTRGTLWTPKGFVEAEYYDARGAGVSYHSGSLTYRMDVFRDFFTAHFILGGHLDYYQPLDLEAKKAFGWHYGGGIALPLAGPFYLRSDFKARFSPGNSTIVSIGLLYRFSGGSSEQ